MLGRSVATTLLAAPSVKKTGIMSSKFSPGKYAFVADGLSGLQVVDRNLMGLSICEMIPAGKPTATLVLPIVQSALAESEEFVFCTILGFYCNFEHQVLSNPAYRIMDFEVSETFLIY
ncbi:MAG: hypothetical protein JSV16_02175 [Candidatus Hydrogenedentota bacterium]|nr:MAG: hypothetical protein JSV16_02175 [Candidatus Hydrogenedentota bacterium]